MQEVKTDNLELFYDCVDESNNLLYEIFHKSYFELIELTVNNILASDVVCDCEPEFVKQLNQISFISILHLVSRGRQLLLFVSLGLLSSLSLCTAGAPSISELKLFLSF